MRSISFSCKLKRCNSSVRVATDSRTPYQHEFVATFFTQTGDIIPMNFLVSVLFPPPINDIHLLYYKHLHPNLYLLYSPMLQRLPYVSMNDKFISPFYIAYVSHWHMACSVLISLWWLSCYRFSYRWSHPCICTACSSPSAVTFCTPRNSN